jgi:signal transduction histidine kinase
LKKALFYLFIFIIFSCDKRGDYSFENLTLNDSIEKNLKKSKDNSLNKEKRVESVNKSYNLIIKSGNSSKNRKFLADISDQYYKLYDVKMLEKSSITLLKYSISENDTVNIASSYNLLAKAKLDLNETDSSYYYFLKAEKLFFIIKDSSDIAKNFIAKSNLLYSTSSYLESEQSAIESLKYIDKSKDLKNNYLANNIIGLSSSELKNYSNSIVYLNNALEIAKSMDSYEKKYYVPISYNNIGFVYQNNNEHLKAIKYFTDGLKNKNLLTEMPDLFANLTDNYAYSKFKLKDYNELPGLFYVSLKIREKNQLNQGIILSKIHLSEYFNYLKDTIKSRKFAEEALQLAKKTKISGDILSSLKQLSIVDEKNAVKYTKEYIDLSDSIQNEERKAKDRFARIAYETDEVIQKNTELEVINRSLVFFLIGIGGIFSLLYVVITQKMKNRELAFKQEQQATNQEIYNMMILHQEKVDATSNYEKNRMAQELHDGVLSKMFGTRMNLDSLNEANDEETIAVRHKYIQELKSIEQEIREISHDLSSVKGKIINNFVLIVIELLEEQKKSFTSDLVYSIEKTMSWEKLDNTAKINFYRILQESLQNSNKYANAKTITVSFFQTEENITMKVEDDGIGFDVAKKKKGIGLKNMISRTEESNGIYELISKQGKGTITTVSIPYNKESPTQTL